MARETALTLKKKIQFAQLKSFMNDLDIPKAFNLETIADFINKELKENKKQKAKTDFQNKTSKIFYVAGINFSNNHTKEMFVNLKNEDSPDGELAREILMDESAPIDGWELLDYLANNADTQSIISYCNIIQRNMDENPNYSTKRINDVDLMNEVRGEFEEDYFENPAKTYYNFYEENDEYDNEYAPTDNYF